MEKYTKDLVSSIDDIAVGLVGLLSLGYCIFVRNFAELSINLPIQPFPIFIGEIALFICSILFISKWLHVSQRIYAWHCILIGYFIFVLGKALFGYFKWGPLALRHAALFYYPLFAIFGYYFYRRDFFDKTKIFLLWVIFMILIIGDYYYPYDIFTCIVLAAILTAKLFYTRYKILDYLFVILFLLIGCKDLFFQGARALLLSNIMSSLFIIVTPFFISNIRKIYRIVILVLLVGIFLLGIFGLADKMALKAVTNFKQTITRYSLYNNVLLREKANFKMTNIKQVRVYNKEGGENVNDIKTKNSPFSNVKTPHAFVKSGLDRQNRIREELLKIDAESLGSSDEAGLEEGSYLRDVDSATTNSIFRIFVWKDLLEDIGRERHLLGFDFGKPFRSKNIEILYLANGEWERDGWVAVHNSYLELIYRGGIVGIILILALFTILFKMIQQSIHLRLLNGILLCGILINWLIVAAFNVILELPYNAIPFWFLFGMSFAYLFKNRESV